METFHIHDFIVKHADNLLSEVFTLQAVDDGVQSWGDDVEQDGRHFATVRPLRAMVHDHGSEWHNQHDQVDRQVGGAGLQRPAVQRLILIFQTHHGDPQVGERDAAEGRAQDDHGVVEAVDVVDEKILAGVLEQGGVDYNPPAACQADGETETATEMKAATQAPTDSFTTILLVMMVAYRRGSQMAT